MKMKCVFEEVDSENRRCIICGHSVRSTQQPQKIYRSCGAVADLRTVHTGPGTELKAIIAQLGLTPEKSCGCNAHVAQMNQWGIDGCREHRAEIIGWLRENWNWGDALKAGVNAVLSGATWLSVTDPLGSVVDEAIRRAEQSTTK